MYDSRQRLFVFSQRPEGARLISSGLSVRYSAIALIGLNAVKEGVLRLGTAERLRIAQELFARSAAAGLGDTALIAWAGSTMSPQSVWDRLSNLYQPGAALPTVQLAWALAALTICGPQGTGGLARAIAARLISAADHRSGLFPHVMGGSGLRSHVTCFADQVYPIHALSLYAMQRGDSRALAVASRCAARICERQGPDGQWWWHYDTRTGTVVEGYPVYAIHQDAMAPMALQELARAGGPRMDEHVERGLAWLWSSPELNGESLIDSWREMVWRKVARREPGKTSRYLQAAASRVSRGLRMPGVDQLFPPCVIDYEDRPYHWGWFLYACGGGLGHAAVETDPV